jgi:acyl CoA:acetate/3-ketoacid CoA transferase alpha subunit
MSIPVTASTEAFTPASMAEVEGAPTFTFRHATVLDKTRFHELKAIARLRSHSAEEMRDVVMHELRKLFTSDGMEQNITKLTAYWAAIDEHEGAIKEYRQQVMELLRAAGDGEMPELPPEPVIDFPKGEIIELNALVDEVERHSEIYAAMRLDNIRFEAGYQRLLLRMFLTDTSLIADLKRDREGNLTEEAAVAVIEALAKAARAAGVDADVAVAELLFKAARSEEHTSELQSR